MVDEQVDSSSSSRVGRILDSIDSFSKNFEFSNDQKKLSSDLAQDLMSNDVQEPVKIDSEPIIIKQKDSILSDNDTMNPKMDEVVDLFDRMGPKMDEVVVLFERMVVGLGSISKKLIVNIQYVIPAIIIFQSALWLAYLSENSVSNGFVSTIADGLGDVGAILLRLITILGSVIAYAMSSSFDSQQSYDAFSLHPNLTDLIFILLIVSSILYLMRRFSSLYILYSVFLVSFVSRILDVDNFSYDWLVMVSVTIISIIFLSIVSIPITRNKIINDRKASKIDLSVLKETSFITEASYQKPDPEVLGNHMDQAPVTKPRRPSRRSEYELYEWVLLLANLILWPAVFFISIILGSGVEVYGDTYNMNENYLMLLGPLFLTLFFFGILFKMDKNARDGSLYAAEKQSYLEEMDKYLKARTSYLELVTLQAESKKQEITNSSEE
ncbi:hypothetical protein OAQ40_00815 [Euryarchaeota archaeon]|nr:hypothetical protein [Euryarchaeota archaeon]